MLRLVTRRRVERPQRSGGGVGDDPEALPIATGTALLTVVVWHRRPWAVLARLHSTLLAGLALVFLAALYSWNLLF